MARVFLVLGFVWVMVAAYHFMALRGDPDRVRAALQYLGMGVINLLVGLFLGYLRGRREGAGR